ASLPGADDSRDLGARVRSAFDPTAERNLDRLARYRIGLAVIRDHPILGIGPEGVVANYERYAGLAQTEGPSHLHNTFLQLLAERGPLGLAAWVVAVTAAMLHALRAVSRVGPEARGAAAGVGLALLGVLALGVFNYHWEDWRVRALTLVLLGLAWAPAVTGPAKPEGSPPRDETSG
ncbi:MAG TPA: O-antigen ligase family protein, partial [Thermodesulfobacteriota bacterium]